MPTPLTDQESEEIRAKLATILSIDKPCTFVIAALDHNNGHTPSIVSNIEDFGDFMSFMASLAIMATQAFPGDLLDMPPDAGI